MAVLAIAGSGRGAGKTAVACALLQALPGVRWVAVKVTPHRHEAQAGVFEELDGKSQKDTGRYLAAGAERAFLISEEKDHSLCQRIAEVRAMAVGTSLLIESNREDAFAPSPDEPGLRLAVLMGGEEDWKPSLAACLADADALILAVGLSPGTLPLRFGAKPRFLVEEGNWATPDLLSFVQRGLLLC